MKRIRLLMMLTLTATLEYSCFYQPSQSNTGFYTSENPSCPVSKNENLKCQ